MTTIISHFKVTFFVPDEKWIIHNFLSSKKIRFSTYTKHFFWKYIIKNGCKFVKETVSTCRVLSCSDCLDSAAVVVAAAARWCYSKACS